MYEKPEILRKDPLEYVPIFENVAICMGCGKEKHVNTCGYCEDCWLQFSHLRKGGNEK